MELINALRLIAGKSPAALHEALGALRAQQTQSPLALRRADRAIELALQDPQAGFTADERQALAALLSGTPDGARTLDVRIRVNADEKQRVQEMAEEAGMTVSDFIRGKIGL